MGLYEILTAELEKVGNIRVKKGDERLTRPSSYMVDEYEEILLEYKTRPFKIFHIPIKFIRIPLTNLEGVCKRLEESTKLFPLVKQFDTRPRYLLYSRVFRTGECLWNERVKIVES